MKRNIMKADWPELEYFVPACRSVLGPYLHSKGFEVDASGARSVGVKFSNGRTALEFTYWLEDSPNYRVLIGISLVRGTSDADPAGVGLGYAMPLDQQETWDFRDEKELSEKLTHLVEHILPAYAEPLWQSPQQIAVLAKGWRDAEHATARAEFVKDKRVRAEQAFKSGKIQEVISIYEALTPLELDATDLKRLELARKRAGLPPLS